MQQRQRGTIFRLSGGLGEGVPLLLVGVGVFPERTRIVRLTGIFLRVLQMGSIFLFLASVLRLRGGVGWGLGLCVGGEWVREKVS